MARFWAATLRARAILPQYGVAARSWCTATRRALRLVLQQNGRWRGVGPNGNTPYSKIDEIDRHLDRYDVEATDAAGQRVELTIDGKTGEILRSERDDD